MGPTFPIQPATPGKVREILVMGERVPVGELVVYDYDQRDHLSFYGSDFAQPPYGDRPGVKTLEQLRDAVHQVVIHTDLTADARACFNALKSRSLSTHFIVDFNGDLYQPLDVFHCAYHAGEANAGSVGVDLNNKMVNLERDPSAPAYPPDHSRIAEMLEHNRPKSDIKTINSARVRSYGYTDAQYRTLQKLLKALIVRLPKIAVAYPTDGEGEVVANTLVEPRAFSGFMAHYHWEMQRWDPGPGFDWERVRGALSNEHNSFPLPLTQNIGDLLDPAKVMAVAEDYYTNNQTRTRGWFPMSENQTWRGGIQLAAPEGTAVKAITDGVVVAARTSCVDDTRRSNNFVLLRHEIPIGAPQKGIAPKTFVFFSLYMHVAPLALGKLEPKTTPRWVRELYGDTPPDKMGEQSCADRAWLELGEHLPALLRGDIAKIGWRENPIFVTSGDEIGWVARFDGDETAKVHVEVFAEPGWQNVVDLGVHGRWLTELEDDLGRDLYVENPSILALFGEAKVPRPARGGAKVLPPSLIEEFWADTTERQIEQRWLRKVVPRHVSEWSDQVDWVLELSRAEGWDDRVRDFRKILKEGSLGRDTIAKVLPYVWLSRDVAAHIGLDVRDWRGVLDHFHPIHFLMWLTYKAGQRVITTSQGRSDKEIRAHALSEEGRREALMGHEPYESTVLAVIEHEPATDDDSLDRWLDEVGPGEWRR